MPNRTPRMPKYCRASKGRAYCRLRGEWISLGKYGTPESRERFDRVVAEWLSGGRRLPEPESGQPDQITVSELLHAYYEDCRRRYAHMRTTKKRLSMVRSALRPIRRLYGRTPAAAFGPKRLLAVREQYITAKMSRATVNERVQVLKRCFRWAVREEIVPPSVYHGLSAVEGLKAGESAAAEPRRIGPVSDSDVKSALPLVLPPVRAMIELQLVSGMRPGEVVQMRTGDIDVTTDPWVYRLRQHKTERHGTVKEIFIGKRGQEILRPLLRPRLDEYLFRPDEAEAERDAERRRNRRTKLWPSHVRRIERKRRRKPKRAPRDHYDVPSYRQAIWRACDKAGIERWGPHRLRHTFATRIRKLHGAEAARICLGHQHLKTAEIYAERDAKVAASVARKHG